MESIRYSPCAACEVRDRAVCGVLQPHELERLNSIVTEVWLNPGQILFLQEDPADSVFNVTRGHIRLLKLLADQFARDGGILERIEIHQGDRQNLVAISGELVSLGGTNKIETAAQRR